MFENETTSISTAGDVNCRTHLLSDFWSVNFVFDFCLVSVLCKSVLIKVMMSTKPILVIILTVSIVHCFPVHYSTDPFYGSTPDMVEMDFPASGFYSTLNGNAPATFGMMPPSAVSVEQSQNRKFFTKTPAHDKHFARILKQQNQATIQNPYQAAVVANDHVKSRLRNTLQTSDDDVYEVESAPVMKRAPFRRQQQQLYRKSMDGDGDIPVSLTFDTEIEHPSNYGPNKRQYRRQRVDSERNTGPATISNLNFLLGLAKDDPEDEYGGRDGRRQYAAKATSYQSRVARPQKSELRPTSSSNKDPYQNIQYSPETPHRSRNEDRHTQPPTPPQHQQYHYQSTPAANNQRPSHKSPHRTSATASSVATASVPQMDSSWLDMGAYSSGKGAFGWYSDVPVGGGVNKK